MPTRKTSSTRRSARKGTKRKKAWGAKRILSTVVTIVFFVVLWSYLSPSTWRMFKSWVGVERVSPTGDYHGIDVSKHQGKIDWEQVASDSNIQFVYIKATEGRTLVDKRYRYNISEARKAGLKVGSYHFFTTRRSAQEQFENFCRHVRHSEQDLIPMVDVEESGCRGASRALLQERLGEFMRLVREEYGKYPLLYSQYRFYNEKLAPEFNKYFIFMARYGKAEPKLHGTGRHNIWQYTERGRVKGIKGHVDLDRFVNGTDIRDIEL